MDRLTKGWVQYLRTNARGEGPIRALGCPLCDADIHPPDINGFKAHVRADAAKHPGLDDDAHIEEAFRSLTIHGKSPTPQ